jgi:hypothetical protein
LADFADLAALADLEGFNGFDGGDAFLDGLVECSARARNRTGG